ncbi:hypothetical protein VNO78_16206 [Psophocarpus tetragonolobus]|uniref:Pectinesterase n=1 Tax=Psophocarpus tetragonolobus TaxID=3891 RepID=A0AAN9SLV6_PSOTE
MSPCATAMLLLLAMATTTHSTFTKSKELHILYAAQVQMARARTWASTSAGLQDLIDPPCVIALRDCIKLYSEGESRLSRMVDDVNSYTMHDALTWVSSVMTNHRTCMDGLRRKGYVLEARILGRNMTTMLKQALAAYANNIDKVQELPQETLSESSTNGLLASWNSETSNADFTVAKDGSGTHKTISEAVKALAANNRPSRQVIYVKSGVYNEKVDIGANLKNVMLVGDGIDKTIITGNKNANQGDSTIGSATFDVAGDGFWARDITFENTAGPEGHQAVALRVSADLSVFYKCSFKGYQDTLLVDSNRQFFRNCHIYGTIDFIFGDASVVFQSCDILLRKPINKQANYITAQGRDDPNKPTGISIHSCQVKPANDFSSSGDSTNNFLGRPWKKYSRTMFMKTNLDGLIDPKGWSEWNGDFALSTLDYGEYLNTGSGASTQHRVNWPGFHVLSNDNEATPFSVNQFLQGEKWIPATGVPFSSGI